MASVPPSEHPVNGHAMPERMFASQVLTDVYEELKAIAAARLRNAGPGATLQPTELVHEAYARLTRDREASFADRRHFVAAAALAMRSVIVDRARAKATQKRGGSGKRFAVEDLALVVERPPEEVIRLDDAIASLQRVDSRSAQVVILRYFLGMTEPQIADVLGITDRTVRRDWTFARGWLHRELARDYGTQSRPRDEGSL